MRRAAMRRVDQSGFQAARPAFLPCLDPLPLPRPQQPVLFVSIARKRGDGCPGQPSFKLGAVSKNGNCLRSRRCGEPRNNRRSRSRRRLFPHRHRPPASARIGREVLHVGEVLAPQFDVPLPAFGLETEACVIERIARLPAARVERCIHELAAIGRHVGRNEPVKPRFEQLVFPATAHAPAPFRRVRLGQAVEVAIGRRARDRRRAGPSGPELGGGFDVEYGKLLSQVRRCAPVP